MEIYERINKLIKEQKISKRKFSQILRDLEPKLKSTGETPTEKTIYKYLSGDINIPIELITYIAETLDISEQELFDINSQTKIKLFKYISDGLDKEQVSYLNKLSSNAKLVNNIKQDYYQNLKQGLSFHHQEEIEKLLSLLQYAPKTFIEKIIKRLEEIKKLTLEDL